MGQIIHPRPCSECTALTKTACSDCMIDRGHAVYVCNKPKCRRKHETLRCSVLDVTGKIGGTIRAELVPIE